MYINNSFIQNTLPREVGAVRGQLGQWLYKRYWLPVMLLATGRLRYCPYKRKIFAAGSLLAEAFSFFSRKVCCVSADKLPAAAILLFIRAPSLPAAITYIQGRRQSRRPASNFCGFLHHENASCGRLAVHFAYAIICIYTEEVYTLWLMHYTNTRGCWRETF